MATRSLEVVITGDSRGFSRAMSQVGKDAQGTENRLKLFSATADSTGSSVSDLSLRVGAFGGSLGRMAPVVATATPALVALGGAAVAAAGSLSAAAAGAGALGTGLAASFAPVLVVGKQVTSRFEAITTAYEAVKTAQKEGTDAARKNAQQALKDLSDVERAAVDSFGRLSDVQTQVLGGASDRIIRAFSRAVDQVAPTLIRLERPFDRLGDAIADVIDRAADALSGRAWTGALRAFVDSAARLVEPFSRIFGSLANIMRDVALASLPLVRDGLKGLADALSGLDATATKGKIRGVVQDLVSHTRSWWRLTKEVGELIFRIFNGGAKDGQSLVDSLTRVVDRWNRFLATKEGQREMRQFFRDAVKASKDLFVILGALAGGIFKVSNFVIRVTNGLQGFERSVGRVDSAINRWISGALRDVVEAITGVIDAVRRLVSRIGNFASDAAGLGKAIVKGIVRGLGGLAGAIKKAVIDGVKGGVSAASGAVSDVVGAINPFGDGIGKLAGKIGDGVGKNFALPTGPFGGSLKGANPALGPFAALGSRFNLGVSSGRFGREGSITSSGNVSYHSTGEAVDIAGPVPNMLRFAREVAAKYGGRLAELIHTPLGFGIKNGVRVAPYATKDHYDHVHVALDLGRPGVGIGDGIGQAAQAAHAAGFRGQALINAVAIAGAESRYDAEAENLQYPDHSIGFWQINQLAHKGRFGSDAQLKNPVTNAKAAFALWRESGFGPWSTWPSAASSYASQAQAAVAGLSGRRDAPGRSGGNRAAGGTGAGQGRQTGPNTATGVGDTGGGKGQGGPPGFDEQLAGVDVAKARAERDDSLPRMIKALQRERQIKQRKLKKINKALKRSRRLGKALGPLRTEKAQLIRDISELNSLLKEYKADQRGGATTITGAEELEAGVGADAGGGDTGGGGEVGEAGPTQEDYANAALAEASLTPGTADDIQAADWLLNVAAGELFQARASGDPRRITEAISAYSAAKAALEQLKGSVDQSNRLADERLELDKQLVDNQKKLIRLAETQGPQLIGAVVAAVNGSIGGQLGLGGLQAVGVPGQLARH